MKKKIIEYITGVLAAIGVVLVLFGGVCTIEGLTESFSFFELIRGGVVEKTTAFGTSKMYEIDRNTTLLYTMIANIMAVCLTFIPRKKGSKFNNYAGFAALGYLISFVVTTFLLDNILSELGEFTNTPFLDFNFIVCFFAMIVSFFSWLDIEHPEDTSNDRS